MKVKSPSQITGAPLPFVALLLPAVLVTASLLSAGCGDLTAGNPRFEQPPQVMGDQLLPSVLRFVSSNGEYVGATCFGLVLKAEEGIPRQVLNLTAVKPTLGSSLESFLGNGGFDLADELFDASMGEVHAGLVESIDPNRLAEVIKPPVDVSREQLEALDRVIIGVGFNYGEHKLETRTNLDRFIFPKFVEPTGAYSPVSLGSMGGMFKGPVKLGDYEVELGFVLLKDLNLLEPPTDPEAFRKSIAYFTVNDVSNRQPIIVQGDRGFTKGKSHPTYLPLGPWMVHGRHIDLRTMSGGRESLRLWTRIDEAEPHGGGTWRQDASTDQMIRGPFEIIRMTAEIFQDSSQPDYAEVWRGVAKITKEQTIIPGGSIFLTGTPAGTAISAPGGGDRARLAMRGMMSTRRAKRLFARHCVEQRKKMGYLHVGDRVETRVQHLGCQVWEVEQ